MSYVSFCTLGLIFFGENPINHIPIKDYRTDIFFCISVFNFIVSIGFHLMSVAAS